jgi:hypothetical protein
MIEHSSRSAPAPVAAAPIIMRVPGVAILRGSAAKMSSVMVVSMFVVSMFVVSVSVMHVVSPDAI